jgi:uncharacterized protein
MTEKARDNPVLKRFRAVVTETYGDRLERVVLFGSRARGDAQADSDYDVCFCETTRLAPRPSYTG